MFSSGTCQKFSPKLRWVKTWEAVLTFPSSTGIRLFGCLLEFRAKGLQRSDLLLNSLPSSAGLCPGVSVLGSSITARACSSKRRPSQEWEVMLWSVGMQSLCLWIGYGSSQVGWAVLWLWHRHQTGKAVSLLPQLLCVLSPHWSTALFQITRDGCWGGHCVVCTRQMPLTPLASLPCVSPAWVTNFHLTAQTINFAGASAEFEH